jgi:hypothetical protein
LGGNDGKNSSERAAIAAEEARRLVITGEPAFIDALSTAGAHLCDVGQLVEDLAAASQPGFTLSSTTYGVAALFTVFVTRLPQAV